MVKSVLALMLILILTPIQDVHAQSPNDALYRVDATVTEADEIFIREGISYAQEQIELLLGYTVDQRIAVNILDDPEAFTSAYASGHSITISTSHRVWLDSSPLFRLKILVHEYFHIVQADLTGFTDWGAIWLIEGSAEAVAFRIVADSGLVNYEAARERWVQNTLYGPVSWAPLEDMAFPTEDVACCM